MKKFIAILALVLITGACGSTHGSGKNESWSVKEKTDFRKNVKTGAENVAGVTVSDVFIDCVVNEITTNYTHSELTKVGAEELDNIGRNVGIDCAKLMNHLVVS